jgi:hypothetical protein
MKKIFDKRNKEVIAIIFFAIGFIVTQITLHFLLK